MLSVLYLYPLTNAGVTQLVECVLPKHNVAGSSPVSRSIFAFIAHWIAVPAIQSFLTNPVASGNGKEESGFRR